MFHSLNKTLIKSKKIIGLMTLINGVHAREILDSRGNPTVEVDVRVGDFIARASVPSGASTGKYEAVELRDWDKKRFFGKGVKKAVNNIHRFIAPRLRGMDCRKQQEIDEKLILLDGTKDKKDLGANALLGVSMAVCRAGAYASKVPIFRYIANMHKTRHLSLPRLFLNVVNGGKHAGNQLAIQEFMIVPRAASVAERVRIGSEVYHVLKQVIEKKYGRNAVNVGDEGGFAPPLRRAEEALDLIMSALRASGYQSKVDLALDCAASEFHHGGRYSIFGQTRGITAYELLDYYLHLVKNYPIISIEDPFDQDDFMHFHELTQKLKGRVQVIGDDLTVTNIQRMTLAFRWNAINCLLLKMNQIGTVSEALRAARAAHEHGWRVMVSHRSGETTDDFISDLTVGIGAEMIKAGAPARGERVTKYNQLMRIEEMLR